jgi:hypothetical protein
MQTGRRLIERNEFDVISAIWMMSCHDSDTIVTYKGVEYRLDLDGWDVERVKDVVKSHAELFSPVVSSRWLKDWKEWVKKGKHYPGWVLELPWAERDKAIDDLKRDDVFRCQFRNDNRAPGISDPCVPACNTDQVKLGIEHLYNLRKAETEAKEERLKRLTTYIVPLVALVLTSAVSVSSTVLSYLSLENSRQLAKQTADLTRVDELLKLWDFSAKARGDAYEGTFNSMQSAMDAAVAGNKNETQVQLNHLSSDFYRVETLLGDESLRTKLWSQYGQFKQLCSDALRNNSPQRSASLLPVFENLRDQIHDEVFKKLFVLPPEAQRTYQKLMEPDSVKNPK